MQFKSSSILSGQIIKVGGAISKGKKLRHGEKSRGGGKKRRKLSLREGENTILFREK